MNWKHSTRSGNSSLLQENLRKNVGVFLAGDLNHMGVKIGGGLLGSGMLIPDIEAAFHLEKDLV